MLNKVSFSGTRQKKPSATFRIMSVKLDWMKQGSCVSTILWLLAEATAPDGLITLVQGHPLVWKASLCSPSFPGRQTSQSCSVLASRRRDGPGTRRRGPGPEVLQVGSGVMIGDTRR